MRSKKHFVKLLATGAPDQTDRNCHICGKNTKRLLYHCNVCKVNFHINCIFGTMTAPAHENVSWHHHPVLMADYCGNLRCDVCNTCNGHGYICPRCSLVVHKNCVSVFDSPEITHPFHVRHPLKLLTNGAPHKKDTECHFCGDDTEDLLYHCEKCKFNLDINCASRYPPVALSGLKVHEHTLALMPRLISFVCDACGTEGVRAPYVCVQCDFMIFHQECAHLPRVINVNHHDHRISYKYPLGPGEWRCGVCWEEIDWSYGAYSCSSCTNYAIHSKCATRKDVWDGKELDGVPEEVEDVEPFKRNDDNTITHFAHEHNLILKKDGEESILCEACVCPIGFDTFYKCSESDCSFILHETCANLPKKKRHFLSPEPLTLRPQSEADLCRACAQIYGQGFVYSKKEDMNFDLLCSSIGVPFIHGSHDHHLLFLKLEEEGMKICQNCDKYAAKGLNCSKCDYFLDFRCATLPLSVRLPRYDDHPLTLCYGDENISGKYWCDICERETDPKTWFYTCKDCGVSLHVFCVVGDIRYAKLGAKMDGNFELLSNKSSSRPLCNRCHWRCTGPFIFKGLFTNRKYRNQDGYDVPLFCSNYCLVYAKHGREIASYKICPPWLLK